MISVSCTLSPGTAAFGAGAAPPGDSTLRWQTVYGRRPPLQALPANGEYSKGNPWASTAV
jgi:hypothetical protein